MQRAKTFFYVSLGILALTGALHLAAPSAQERAASLTLGNIDEGVVLGVDAAGMIVGNIVSRTAPLGPLQPPKPGRIIALYAGNSIPMDVHVLYDDGDVYLWNQGAWQYLSNIHDGAPVSTTPTTWGRIKAERR